MNAMVSPVALVVAALIIPLAILHFLIRERRRRIVASLLIWMRLEQRLARRRRLLSHINRHLIVQSLVLALLATALGDPRIPGGPDATGDLLILVDTSASMGALDGGVSRIESARRAVRGVLRDIPDSARVHLSESRSRLVSHGSFSATDPALVDEVERLVAHDEEGNLVETLAEARVTAERAGAQLLVYTDGTESLPPGFIPEEDGLVMLVGGATVRNLGILAFALRRDERGTSRALVSVFNGGSRRDAATVIVDGAEPETVELAVGERVDLVIPVEAIRHDAVAVAARLETDDQDALAADNQATAIVGGTPPRSIVYIGPRNLFLDAALGNVPGTRVFYLDRYPDDLGMDLVRGADLLVLHRIDNAPVTGGRVLSVLSTIAGVPVSPAGILEGTVAGRWSADNVLRSTGVGVPPEFAVENPIAYRLDEIAQPLVTVDGEAIAWTREGVDLSIVHLGFALERSALPVSEEFPLFVYRLVRHLGLDNAAGTFGSYRTGRTIPLPGNDPMVELPEGRLVRPERIDGTNTLVDTSRQGVYRIRDGERVYPVAFNLASRRESQILRLPENRTFPAATEGSPVLDAFSSAEGGRSMAGFFIVLAVLLLVIDSLHWVRTTGSPGIDWPALVGRVLVAMLLGIALFDLPLRRTDTDITTAYLVDVSGSTSTEARRRAFSIVLSSRELNQNDEDARLFLFAGDVAAREFSSESEPILRLQPDQTRIDRAIRVAAASLPATGDRRIILLSDGNQTAGSAGQAVEDAHSAGIRISTIAVGGGRRDPADAVLSGLSVPSAIPPEGIYEIVVAISGGTGPGILRIERNGAQIAERELLLDGPDAIVRIPDRAPAVGIVRYRAVLESAIDPVVQNNDYRAITRVDGPASILYIGPESDRPFARALRAGGSALREISPAELSRNPLDLLPYRAIVLDDLAASSLSISHMEALERYVREIGGGVVFLGGPRSLAAGDYRGTAVEELLPLSMDVAMPVQIPSLTMLFLIDKSGSMNSSSRRDVSKLRVVQEAVLASLEVMQPNQLVGVMSFDSDYELIVPLTRAGDRTTIVDGIRTLAGGGGTVLDAALQEAGRILGATESGVRHIVILSDGLVRDAPFRPLVRSLREGSITVSTISVGNDADRELMRLVAEEGAGRSYHSDGLDDIPRIFAEEANLVSRMIAVEETIFPSSTRDAEALGLALDPLPPVDGFVLTYPKAPTRRLWSAAEGQPLLAVWRYGLGRSAAFTSSLDAVWGRRWVEWSELPRFAAQLLDWVGGPSGSLLIEAEREAETITVRLEDSAWTDRSGALRPPVLSILDGSGTITLGEMAARAPGSYEYRATSSADVVVRVDGADGVSAFDPVALAPPQEYRQVSVNRPLLAELARRGGGVFLDAPVSEVPIDILPALESSIAARGPLRRLALLGAAIVLVIEVAYSLARRRSRSYT